MRKIICEVNDEYLNGDGVVIGAAGSHNDVKLRITFNDGWDHYTKYIVWTNAVGENPTIIYLGDSLYVDGAYEVPIPTEAKEIAGYASMSIKGYTVDPGEEDVIEGSATLTATAKFRVLESTYSEPSNPSASETEQIFADLDTKANKTDVNNSIETLNGSIEAIVSDVYDLNLDVDDIKGDLETKADKTYVDNQIQAVEDILDTKASSNDLTALQEAMISKVNNDYLEQNYYNQSVVVSMVSAKADQTYVDNGLALKANIADVDRRVNKVDNKASYVVENLETKADVTYVDSQIQAVEDILDTKASNNDLTALQNVLYNKVDSSYLEQNYYNKSAVISTVKTYVNNQIQAVEDILDTKADQTYVDNGLALKANVNDVYTKPEIDSKLDDKADVSYVDTKFTGVPQTMVEFSADSLEGASNLTIVRLYFGTSQIEVTDLKIKFTVDRYTNINKFRLVQNQVSSEEKLVTDGSIELSVHTTPFMTRMAELRVFTNNGNLPLACSLSGVELFVNGEPVNIIQTQMTNANHDKITSYVVPASRVARLTDLNEAESVLFGNSDGDKTAVYYGAPLSFESRNVGFKVTTNFAVVGAQAGAFTHNSSTVYAIRFKGDTGAFRLETFNGETFTDTTHNTDKTNGQLDAVDGHYPHCNMAFFDTRANGGVLRVYVNEYKRANNKGTLRGFTISGDKTNGYTGTLAQTIQIGFINNVELWATDDDDRPYGNFAFDSERNKLIAYVPMSSKGITRFFEFDMPEASETTVILNESDILQKFDMPLISIPQDNFAKDGKVYIIAGDPTNTTTPKPAECYVVDMYSKQIITVLPLSDWKINQSGEEYISKEPQFIDWLGKAIYICTTNRMYKINVPTIA